MATERFYSSTDKLINAFLMGTIEHQKCKKCAVGIICDGGDDWAKVLWSSNSWKYYIGKQRLDILSMIGKWNDTIKSTGYSISEIAIIESEFEKADTDEIDDPDCFLGLCNVFDYLVSIEDWKDEERGVNIFELLETVN